MAAEGSRSRPSVGDDEEEAVDADGETEELKLLANLVNGCKDDAEGIDAKVSLVRSFVSGGEGPNADLLHVMCWMHSLGSLTLSYVALLTHAKWRAAAPALESTKDESGTPGLYVASVLSTCPVDEMGPVVAKYIQANPHVDPVALIRYINRTVGGRLPHTRP